MSGPFCTTVPPIVAVQNFFCASTSFTNKWMCPMVTPELFAGASCAEAGNTANAAAIRTIKHRIFIAIFFIKVFRLAFCAGRQHTSNPIF
jgi:hypothetical protein